LLSEQMMIQRLPMHRRILVIEKTLHSIRKEENTKLLKKAASVLYIDYKTDKELTEFTNLDFIASMKQGEEWSEFIFKTKNHIM